MKKLLFFIGTIFFVPLVCSSKVSINSTRINSGFMKNDNKKVIIRVLKDDNSIINMNLEDYLIGVVSSEVPISFETEALKAQAVASRTYALKQIENNKDKNFDVTTNVLSQVYSSDDELKEKWKDQFNNNYNRIKKAVYDTKNEYVSYDDQIIYAFFFSTSNGKTEDNKYVFGEDLPYLKPVDSSFDEEETENFKYKTEFLKEEFYSKLEIPYSDSLSVDYIEKTESGRINSVDINGNVFKGRDFQKKLSLRSNDFIIEEIEDKIIITTKGFGHGVGMSQYGANALAKRKKNYRDILEYYYKGTKIKKL